jgi:hypothetical protein
LQRNENRVFGDCTLELRQHTVPLLRFERQQDVVEIAEIA